MKPEVKRNLHAAQWIKLGLLAALVFGAYAVWPIADVADYLDPESLRGHLESLGVLAPLGFVVVMALAVVISPIPSLPLDLAAGAAFGPFWGTVYAVMGAEIGAIASFLIGRALGREVLTRLLRVDVKICPSCSDRQLMGIIFMSRLLPIFSFDIVSYGAGLTAMSLKAFAWATLLGMIPPTFALTYFGYSVVFVQWPVILAGLVLAGLLLLLPKFMLQHRSTKWVQIISGQAAIPVINQQEPGFDSQSPLSKCPFCGKSLSNPPIRCISPGHIPS